jgi:hypothetical protein
MAIVRSGPPRSCSAPPPSPSRTKSRARRSPRGLMKNGRPNSLRSPPGATTILQDMVGEILQARLDAPQLYSPVMKTNPSAPRISPASFAECLWLSLHERRNRCQPGRDQSERLVAINRNPPVRAAGQNINCHGPRHTTKAARGQRSDLVEFIGSILPFRGRNAHDGYFDHTGTRYPTALLCSTGS